MTNTEMMRRSSESETATPPIITVEPTPDAMQLTHLRDRRHGARSLENMIVDVPVQSTAGANRQYQSTVDLGDTSVRAAVEVPEFPPAAQRVSPDVLEQAGLGSSTQQTEISAVSTTPPSLSVLPESESASFRALLSMAEATVRKLRAKPPEQRTFARAREYAYHYNIYFPHPLEHIASLVEQRTPEQNRSEIVVLGRLADEYAAYVEIVAQRHRIVAGASVSPGEALRLAEISGSSEYEIRKTLGDAYIFYPRGPGTPVLASPVDAKVSINVQPKYAHLLPQVFVELCKNNFAEVCQYKFFGPRYWGIRTETGICYLPKPDLEKATHVREVIHDMLIKKLGTEVSANELYLEPPPWAQKISAGSSYSEMINESSSKEGGGGALACNIAQSAIEHLETGKDLAECLRTNVEKSRYLASNLAFVVLPGEDIQAARDRVNKLLISIDTSTRAS